MAVNVGSRSLYDQRLEVEICHLHGQPYVVALKFKSEMKRSFLILEGEYGIYAVAVTNQSAAGRGRKRDAIKYYATTSRQSVRHLLQECKPTETRVRTSVRRDGPLAIYWPEYASARDHIQTWLDDESRSTEERSIIDRVLLIASIRELDLSLLRAARRLARPSDISLINTIVSNGTRVGENVQLIRGGHVELMSERRQRNYTALVTCLKDKALPAKREARDRRALKYCQLAKSIIFAKLSENPRRRMTADAIKYVITRGEIVVTRDDGSQAR